MKRIELSLLSAIALAALLHSIAGAADPPETDKDEKVAQAEEAKSNADRAEFERRRADAGAEQARACRRSRGWRTSR